RRIAALRVATVLLLSGTAVFAQVSTSSITGVVQDASGAVVSGAKVVATNEDTGVAFTTTTTSAGGYTIASVTPGRYTITITHSGFDSFSSVHNVLATGAPLVLNAQLRVGTVSESVEVESTYQRIETTNATISDIMTTKQVQNLPLNGRNPLSLLTLDRKSTRLNSS